MFSSGSYTPGTSCACSCIPEAYLVHRAEGGEVENLDINPYILTNFIKMHTMHTLHTFFIKFIYEGIGSKVIKNIFRHIKIIIIARVSHPHHPFPRRYAGLHGLHGLHGGKKRLNKHIFHAISRQKEAKTSTFSTPFSRHAFFIYFSQKPARLPPHHLLPRRYAGLRGLHALSGNIHSGPA